MAKDAARAKRAAKIRKTALVKVSDGVYQTPSGKVTIRLWTRSRRSDSGRRMNSRGYQVCGTGMLVNTGKTVRDFAQATAFAFELEATL